MKVVVVVLVIGVVGRCLTLPQFQFPGFNLNIPGLQIGSQVPFSFTTASPSVPSGFTLTPPTSPSPQNPFQNFLPTQRTFDQLFNSSLPNTFFTSNPIASIIQDFTNLVGNITANFLPQSGFRQFSASNDYDSIPQSIRKSFQAAFERLGDAVNAAFGRGLGRVVNSLEQLNATALSVIAVAEDLVNSSLQDIERNIAQYNETIQQCVRSNASAYQDILPEARDEAINCVNNILEAGSKIYFDTLDDINASVNGALNLSATINKCSEHDFNFGSIACYTSAIFNIQSETVFLPLQMTRRFGEAVQLISAASADMAKCGANIGETAAEQSLNVTRTIANCLFHQNWNVEVPSYI